MPINPNGISSTTTANNTSSHRSCRHDDHDDEVMILLLLDASLSDGSKSRRCINICDRSRISKVGDL